MSIQVGDVVMIVWSCCPEARRRLIGVVFTVMKITHEPLMCPGCWLRAERTIAHTDCPAVPGNAKAIPIEYLMKLPPPEQARELDPVTVPRETVDA